MPFHNKLIPDPQPPDTAERVVFNTLQPGDRYRVQPNGHISLVTQKHDDYMVVKRDHGWLVDCLKGGWVWDREVIRIRAPVRK
jgi:hypothetical protein